MRLSARPGPATVVVKAQPRAQSAAGVKRLRWAFRNQHPLVSESAPTAWVQLCKLGVFKGYAEGEAFDMNASAFEQMIHNFERQQNAIPLKYEHPMYAVGEPIPAAGWIHKLRVEGEWLMGFCEFTERAAKLIRAGEYRFTSIVFDLDARDRVSGEKCGAVLYEVGIVNNPFIDGQTPLSLPA